MLWRGVQTPVGFAPHPTDPTEAFLQKRGCWTRLAPCRSRGGGDRPHPGAGDPVRVIHGQTPPAAPPVPSSWVEPRINPSDGSGMDGAVLEGGTSGQDSSLAVPIPPRLPGIFPGELALCPDSVPIHKVQHQLSCQQQGKHPVGRALNGSRKGKDKELASFWSPRWAAFFSLAGSGCNGSIGEVIYRNTVNYRNLLCKKVGEGLQQLWLAVGGGRGAGQGGRTCFSQENCWQQQHPSPVWHGTGLLWPAERWKRGHCGGDSHSHHQTQSPLAHGMTPTSTISSP